MITWNQWLYWACLKLNKIFNPRRDAEIILGTILNKSRAQLLAFGETFLQSNTVKILNALVRRRSKGEPIAYLIGYKEFWSLNFQVASGTFIPRPDTECLIEHVLNLYPIKYLNVLDLGVGVGTIALTLASERPYWNILGIDIHLHALKLSKKNRSLFNINNVQFIYGNWFKFLQPNATYNLIVSNPPYIDKEDACLLINDMNFEPRNALVSENLGLADLTLICKEASKYLCQNGKLILEHGWNQGKFIRRLFHYFGFTDVETKKDYNGHERITYGTWK